MRRGSVTAQDLAEEKARRLRDDPEYRAAVEKAESERSARAEERQRASQPILEDLRRAGVNLDSLWQLYKQPEAYDLAMPVLLMHLRREHPETLMETVGDALPNKAAKWWDDLKDIYLTTRSEAVLDRVAAALSGCATRQHYEDLLAFVAHETLGNSRIYFLRPINRIGNRATPGAGRAVIERLASDPVLGVEANAILRGKSRKQ